MALNTDDTEYLMNQVVSEVTATLDADFCKILKYLPDNNSFLMMAGYGWDQSLVGKIKILDGTNSQAAFTLNASKPVIFEDLPSEKRFTGTALQKAHKVMSGLSCIVENGLSYYGVISVHTQSKRVFTHEDGLFLESAGKILSTSLNRTSIEKQLRESEKRLRIAKDSNLMGSFEYVIKSGDANWDKLLQDIWGVYKEKIAWQDFEKGIHPEDIKYVLNAVENSVNLVNGGHYLATYRVINRVTKQTSWVEATGQIIFENEEPVKMIGMVIDITEKKKLESSLKDAIQQLETADEKKNEFLATLGHELRNPLAAISAGLNVLKLDQQKLDWALSMMENNVHLVSSLLDDLLDLTRISRGQISLKKEPADLCELIKEIEQNFVSKMRDKNLKLTMTLPDRKLSTMLDKIRIQQVVTNVVNNAVKFTPENGKINISANQVKDKLEIVIEDSGIGLDMAKGDSDKLV